VQVYDRVTIMILSGVMSTALEVADGSPLPAEFRIFKPGVNATAKGDFDYDAEARATMLAASQQRGGVRYMIDLEHDSLHPERRAQRSDAGDARGWFSLDFRSDGSLWATRVEWTPDGARRLKEKTQAYISPAFKHVIEGGKLHPLELLNAALCAVPAIHDAPALVAASSLDLRLTPARSARVVAALGRAASISKSHAAKPTKKR
jgi:phage I-like protein